MSKAKLPAVPSEERLDAMLDALYLAASEGKALDVEMCSEIATALYYIRSRRTADERAQQRGRPVAWDTLTAVTVAFELMNEHGASAKAAAIAALPGGTPRECGSIERACRKLRRRVDSPDYFPGKGDIRRGVIVSPGLVAEAALRLPKKR